MKTLRNYFLLLLKPQLVVLYIAGLALSAWLLLASYKPTVIAADSRSLSATADTVLPPETNLQLTLKPLAFSIDCSLKPCLALTFDDGPDTKVTPQIVETLEKTDTKATFFVIGNRIAGHEALLQRMQSDGYEIGNHSWSHPDFTRLSPEQIRSQIESTQNALQTAGVPTAKFFRLPYGHLNAAIQKNVPLPIVLWNIDPTDWHQTDPAKLVEAVEATAKPGGIVVMHDTESITAAALPNLLPWLQQRYQLVTLSELLRISPGADGNTVIY